MCDSSLFFVSLLCFLLPRGVYEILKFVYIEKKNTVYDDVKFRVKLLGMVFLRQNCA